MDPSKFRPYTQELIANGYEFSEDWFAQHVPLWEKWILPMFKGHEIACLEVGTYEGLSAVWVVNNLLSHPLSTLNCVDHWPNPEILQRFDRNMDRTGRVRQVVVNWMRSYPALVKMAEANRQFDFMYIDGGHDAFNTMQDAAIAWDMLKPTGLMVFDDYPWQHPKDGPAVEVPPKDPKAGIDAILSLLEGRYTLLHKGWQVILQKI